MTDSPILEKIGLTRPQVMHLTRDMRLPFDDIRGPGEGGEMTTQPLSKSDWDGHPVWWVSRQDRKDQRNDR